MFDMDTYAKHCIEKKGRRKYTHRQIEGALAFGADLERSD